MACCSHCAGIEREFGDGTAAADLWRYRRFGPLPATRALLGALRRAGVGGATLLDVGGGVGTIHHELLAAGASRAVHVDASAAYLDAAREEARRRRHDGRVEFRHGDFVELAPDVAPADVVTLDRVICCYPDMERLVGRAAERASRLLGLVFPREAWWMRPLFPAANGWFRLRRCPFRIFLHSGEAIDAAVRAGGLRRVFHRYSGMWQVAVYARPGGAVEAQTCR